MLLLKPTTGELPSGMVVYVDHCPPAVNRALNCILHEAARKLPINIGLKGSSTSPLHSRGPCKKQRLLSEGNMISIEHYTIHTRQGSNRIPLGP